MYLLVCTNISLWPYFQEFLNKLDELVAEIIIGFIGLEGKLSTFQFYWYGYTNANYSCLSICIFYKTGGPSH